MIVSAAIVTPLPSPAARAHMEKKAASAVRTSIRELSGGLAAGDEEAFRQFHSAYFNRLLRYLFVATKGDEHAAHEALQETMTRVVRYARRFDSEEVCWSWLTVLARAGPRRTARPAEAPMTLWVFPSGDVHLVAAGGMTAFRREPSRRRTSTIGEASSSRRPAALTTRLTSCRSSSSVICMAFSASVCRAGVREASTASSVGLLRPT